ncbi:MAG: acyl-CoA thioesterase II [Gemmatimonadaceae bacterium]|jgi:acyl-CoA thioesterase-2|nr:acyl-CoA thioesterase II [Gemmatimonadaceae bacterium]
MTDPTVTEPLPSGSVQPLVELLDLEPIEVNIYRGANRDLGSGRVFGGQVFAQALVAARRTVPDDRQAHSAHGYFILPGDLTAPIVYFVDTLRDGNSFTTRRVTAIQHGRAIFNLSASFHVQEEGLAHQMHSWPTVPQPESLTPELELIRQRAARIPDALRPVLTQDRPIDFRPIAPIDPFAPEPREPVRHTWFRAMGALPDDPIIHQAVLAYASDHGLITTALHPHGVSFRTPGMQLASLDHSLWLHRPFRADEWLLYTMDSPVASGARGFSRGAIYSRDGTLVASVAQEGLMRLRKPDVRTAP